MVQNSPLGTPSSLPCNPIQNLASLSVLSGHQYICNQGNKVPGHEFVHLLGGKSGYHQQEVLAKDTKMPFLIF